MKIVTDITKLKSVCEPVVDIKEGEQIAKELFKALTESRTLGVGLSAPQIGINKRVCVIKVKDPLYLINPRITEKSGEFVYAEGCLSFPGMAVRTKRYSKITVESDNHAGKLFFDVSSLTPQEIANSPDALEIAAIQHEIDHMDGVLMFDREYKLVPIKKDKEIGRNEIVRITNGVEFMNVKYKKLSDFKGWIIAK